MTQGRTTTLIAALCAITLVAACDDPVEANTPTTIDVSPASVSLQSLDETVQLTATVKNQQGQAMSGVAVAWTSSNAATATVDASGLVTAVANGTATVTATAGSLSGRTAVTVEQVPVAVVVAQDSLELSALGDTVRLEATFVDANGHEIAEVAWVSADPSVATVDASGLVTATGNGTTTVTAKVDSVSGSVAVTVKQLIVAASFEPGSLAPAEAGKQGRDTIVVTVTDRLGSPVPRAGYRWTTDRHSGWIYPRTGVTDGLGRITATWVAGWPGRGQFTLDVGEKGARHRTKIDTRSTGSKNHPSGAVYFWVNSPVSTGYSVDLTPLAEPDGTYYASIQWDGGYTGLQRRGSHYDRQLQFSVWDVVDGDGTARVVETGKGVRCYTFGGEGTGTACNLNYPWKVGSTYRFEVTESDLNGGSAMTLYITDLASDERRFVGTLRIARRVNLRSFGTFVEDFWMRGEHCLAQEVRSAAIRRAMARVDGEWQPLLRARFSKHPYDFKNPGTPPCANQAAEIHAAGLRFTIGGETSRDPNGPTIFRIPN